MLLRSTNPRLASGLGSSILSLNLGLPKLFKVDLELEALFRRSPSAFARFVGKARLYLVVIIPRGLSKQTCWLVVHLATILIPRVYPRCVKDCVGLKNWRMRPLRCLCTQGEHVEVAL